MRTFEYVKPTSVPEVVELLAGYGEEAKLIAGGTDLMVQWKKRLVSPGYVVSLRNVPELNFVRINGDLTIGAATTHRTLELSAEIRRAFPVISDAVMGLGSVQVRNSATIGGNICNAAPSADTAPPLLVLDTQVTLAARGATRLVPITEFFKGPGRTVVQPGELLTQFSIPRPLPRTGMAYWKHTRRKAMDLPILGVALLLSWEEDLVTCKKARIGLGVAAPVPMRAFKAEAYLEGKQITDATLAEAGRIAAQEASPRTTIRGSQWYRTEMIKALAPRVGLICKARANG